MVSAEVSAKTKTQKSRIFDLAVVNSAMVNRELTRKAHGYQAGYHENAWYPKQWYPSWYPRKRMVSKAAVSRLVSMETSVSERHSYGEGYAVTDNPRPVI